MSEVSYLYTRVRGGISFRTASGRFENFQVEERRLVGDDLPRVYTVCSEIAYFIFRRVKTEQHIQNT